MRPGASGLGLPRPDPTGQGARGLRPEPPCAELRCGCGSLLARRVDAGVELKCRRCKRTVVLPLSDS